MMTKKIIFTKVCEKYKGLPFPSRQCFLKICFFVCHKQKKHEKHKYVNTRFS